MPALGTASPRVGTQGGKWGNEPNDVSCEGGDAKTMSPTSHRLASTAADLGAMVLPSFAQSQRWTQAIPAQSVGKMSWGTLDRIPDIGTKPLWHTNKTNTSFQGESAEVKTALCCLRFRVGSLRVLAPSQKRDGIMSCVPDLHGVFLCLEINLCQEGGTGWKSMRQGGAGGRKKRRRIDENKFCLKMLSGNLIFCMVINFLI